MNFLDFPDDDPRRQARRPLLFFLLATLGIGALGSIFSEPNLSIWYASLNHPSFAPPDSLFAPIWTALYIAMAVAAWRVWKVKGLNSPAITAYGVQLLLNLTWTGLFFGLHQIGAALAGIAVLWLAILITTILFWRADRLAACLMLPYLVWTGFAVGLNYVLWTLNG